MKHAKKPFSNDTSWNHDDLEHHGIPKMKEITKNPAKKAAPKKNHLVNMTLQSFDISKAGSAVEFEINNKHGLLGYVQIGKGTFGWKPKHKKEFETVNWTKFAEKIEQIL
jgi:hypothetical protein